MAVAEAITGLASSNPGTALGIIATACAVALKFGYEYLTRNRVVQAENDVKVDELEKAQMREKAWSTLIEAALKQASDARREADDAREEADKRVNKAETRAEEIFQRSIKEREDYIKQGSVEREKDRKELVTLSSQVHQLTRQVNDLRTKNDELSQDVNRLTAALGGRRSNDVT